MAEYGTQTAEVEVIEPEAATSRFIAFSDCAAVMVNTLTRFTCCEQMDFSTEIRISDQYSISDFQRG